ncbi:AAA family ATPase [Citrobacter freundii]|uniref:AAA family ATPase n=1 Tax=Citrobacter freundii TaxID=546 RepID=UPI00243326AC|nr:AAA family ATPase [Citrobacter freundii]WFU96550.1 AAA family ATPase [Citrobacter freundii]
MTTAIDKTTTNTESRKGRTSAAEIAEKPRTHSADRFTFGLWRKRGACDVSEQCVDGLAYVAEFIQAGDELLPTPATPSIALYEVFTATSRPDTVEALKSRVDALGASAAWLEGEDRALIAIPHTKTNDFDAWKIWKEILKRLETPGVDIRLVSSGGDDDGNLQPFVVPEDFIVDFFGEDVIDVEATADRWGFKVIQSKKDCSTEQADPRFIKAARHQGQPLIEGMVDIGDYGTIYAAPNVGKTTLAVHMAFCVANGMSLFGHMRTLRSHVIYADLEFNSIDDMLTASARYHTSRPGWYQMIHQTNVLPDLGNDAEIDTWCNAMLKITNGEPCFIVIDTQRKAAQLSTRAGQPLKENDNDNMTVIANALQRIAHRMNGAAFSLHHTTKANGEAMAGGGALEAGITSAFCLTVPDKSKPDQLNLMATKRRGNGMPKGTPYGIQMVEVKIMDEDDADEAVRRHEKWFADSIPSGAKNTAINDQKRATFATGPRTHARTFFPGLFEAFEVKQGALSANAAKQDQKRDRMQDLRAYIEKTGNPIAAFEIAAEFGVSKRVAIDYLKTMEASCTIKCVEPASGRKAARYIAI